MSVGRDSKQRISLQSPGYGDSSDAHRFHVHPFRNVEHFCPIAEHVIVCDQDRHGRCTRAVETTQTFYIFAPFGHSITTVTSAGSGVSPWLLSPRSVAIITQWRVGNHTARPQKKRARDEGFSRALSNGGQDQE